MSNPNVTAISGTNSGTSEGVICTTNTVSAAPTGGQGNFIQGVVNGTGNASASTITVKVRQGSNTTTGTQVGTTGAVGVAAGAVFSIPFAFLDASAASAGVTNYSVTTTASAAQGASGAMTGAVSVETAEDVD